MVLKENPSLSHSSLTPLEGEWGNRASREAGEVKHGSPASLDRLALSRHRCGRPFLTIQCSRCGHRRVILAGSRDRTCPACSRELYSRIYRRYEEVILEARNLKFVTFTWRPVRHQDPKVPRSIGKALTRFLHLQRYRRLWKGLLAVLECKKTPSGMFYYHIHLLVDGGFVPQGIISADWRKASGFPIVWVKRVSRTPRRALHYILKYVLKGFSFHKDKDRQDFKESMKGVRYIRSYGEFYNFEYREGKHVYFPCPSCGAVKSWVVLEYCDLVDLWEGEPYDNG
jgi:hypothetical protein